MTPLSTPDLDFPAALTAMTTANVRVRRESWPPGAFLVLVPGSEFRVAEGRPLGDAAPDLLGTTVRYAAHIDLYRDGDMTVWTPTQPDLLAHDWTVIP